jgi:hypothetical protein
MVVPVLPRFEDTDHPSVLPQGGKVMGEEDRIICGLNCPLYIQVFGCLIALLLVRINGSVIGQDDLRQKGPFVDMWPEVRKSRLCER